MICRRVSTCIGFGVLLVVMTCVTAAPASAGPVGLSIPVEDFFTGGRERAPRGPLIIREEWLLAQPHLTLPPTSPDPLRPGGAELRFSVNRGNDFGWNQTTRGENPQIRRFMVDGEHQTTEVHFRRGLTKRWSAGVRIPVQYRGAGFLDGVIDVFHGVTGLADNIRGAFFNDRFRIEGFIDGGAPFSLNDSKGWGLGNVEVDVHYAFKLPRCRSDWRAAVVGRVGLPTGSGPFSTGSVDLGVQLVVAKKLWNRIDAYGGIGATWFSETKYLGITYEPVRGNAFFALEWQVNSRWSVILDTTFTSRLVEDIWRYQTVQWYLDLGAKYDLSRRCTLEFGFTENLENQQTTIDFGMFLGLQWRW